MTTPLYYITQTPRPHGALTRDHAPPQHHPRDLASSTLGGVSPLAPPLNPRLKGADGGLAPGGGPKEGTGGAGVWWGVRNQTAQATNQHWQLRQRAGTTVRLSQWVRGTGPGAAGEDGGGGPVAGRAGAAGRGAGARRGGGRADRGAPQTRALAVQTVPGCGLGQLGAVGPAGQRHGHDPVHPPHPRRAEQAGSRVEPSALLPAGLGDAGALQNPRARQEEPERGRFRHLVHQGQDAAGTCVWEQGQLPGAGSVRGHVSQRGEAAGGSEEEVQPGKPARVPLHLGHGEQRLADLRPRPRRAPHGAGRLHGHGAQPGPRHLPGHPLRQEAPDGADGHRRQARVEGVHRRAGRAPAPRVLLRHVLGHRGPVRQPRHHLAEAVPADGGAHAGGGEAGSGSVPARRGQPETAGNGGAAGAHERPGPVPHRLLLAGGRRLRHRHRHHPLQQVAGAEPQTLLLTAAFPGASTGRERPGAHGNSRRDEPREPPGPGGPRSPFPSMWLLLHVPRPGSRRGHSYLRDCRGSDRRGAPAAPAPRTGSRDQRPPGRDPGEPSPALRLSRMFPPRTGPWGSHGGPWARGGLGRIFHAGIGVVGGVSKCPRWVVAAKQRFPDVLPVFLA